MVNINSDKLYTTTIPTSNRIIHDAIYSHEDIDFGMSNLDISAIPNKAINSQIKIIFI